MGVTQAPIQVPYLPVGDIQLPAELGKLYELAYNLWWTWTPRAEQLFAAIDSLAWAMYHNPVELLINVPPARWEQLLGDETFMSAYESVATAFEQYVNDGERRWFARAHGDYAGGPIAYFSMEYGLHQSLPLYAGGLGVLSGDHLKSASDLGVPLVGVGLLYRSGYFRQTVDGDGFQQHTYLEYDFNRLPLRPAAGAGGSRLVVRVPFPGRDVAAGVWVAQVGRVPLLLLSTHMPENDPADRPITNILYVPNPEMRLTQEVVLGVGGVRALRALGVEPAVWHLNEGHCALVQLERLRELVVARGMPLEEGVRRVCADAVFTTHTPVPAGNERYDAALARKYLEPFTSAALPGDRLLAFGFADGGMGGTGGTPEQAFNLTALGVRASGYANAVSRLNAEVCDRMWRHLRPDTLAEESAIRPITNGVHTATWCGAAMRDLLERYLGADWQELLLVPEAWEKIHAIPDGELWAAHLAQKQRLCRFLRSRLCEQLARHGRPPDELRAVSAWFDPNVLTIGFARRFATYKRAGLIFSDLDRLRALVTHAERPVQICLSGKAHPVDRPGQDLIRQTMRLSREPALRGRVCFLEDYDMRAARTLVAGADVWLNTPRRPMEASGTSGQKAAMNGALNVSILDGWWPEAYDGQNGWAITAEPAEGDEAAQDRADAEALYRLLEQAVTLAYYGRDERGLPRRWLAMVKRSLATITPRFSASRMVQEYAEQAYLPAAWGAAR